LAKQKENKKKMERERERKCEINTATAPKANKMCISITQMLVMGNEQGKRGRLVEKEAEKLGYNCISRKCLW